MTGLQFVALRRFSGDKDKPRTNSGTAPGSQMGKRLRIPALDKDCSGHLGTKAKMLVMYDGRNVKLKVLMLIVQPSMQALSGNRVYRLRGGKTKFAEVQYYFQMSQERDKDTCSRVKILCSICQLASRSHAVLFGI